VQVFFDGIDRASNRIEKIAGIDTVVADEMCDVSEVVGELDLHGL
jgi:hypothetical protein